MNEYYHKLSKQVCMIAEQYQKNYNVHIAIGKLKGLKFSVRKGDGKPKRFRGRISQFPYIKLTNLISYKCREIGIKHIELIDEFLTSKTCHKCGSKNTIRPTQALLRCIDCGLEYNADANGAINIALKYWQKKTQEDITSIKIKFINSKLQKRPQSKAEVNGYWEKTHQNELAESGSE
jgi:IS605 OrfB family transposase